MVGRVEPWKGQDVFLDAIAALPGATRAGTAFALVGGPVPGKEAFFEQVAARARALGVHVLGARGDVPDLLRAADVAVHCSVAPEPLGAVVLEGMLAGAAMVATAHGGVPEIVACPDQGLLVPPGDPAALAQTLAALLDDPRPPRDRFGAAGRARALALTDRDTVAARLLDLYGGLLAGAPARPAASRPLEPPAVKGAP